MENRRVMLIALYNKKALGVRFLETSLVKAGYEVRTVFFKDFNSVNPDNATPKELEILRDDIIKTDPIMIGLSVMSSLYLETVYEVIEMLRKNFSIPIVCGGVFASICPDRLLTRGADYLIRSDGEIAICRLADAFRTGGDPRGIPSVCYMDGDKMVINEIADITNEIDQYGIPAVKCMNACFINSDTLTEGDPQLDTLAYEIVSSRGCPFTCSYCGSSNLCQLLPKGIHHVRYRSVKSVTEELILAKQLCKKIVFVHFYDEVFPNLPGWVDEFVTEYKKHIDLPFTIWTHPNIIREDVMKKLVSVGLTEVIMGIQSGSEHIRRDVFHRYEKREDIIKATKIIHESGVFWATYDFILQSPFESIEDLKDTYRLVKELHGVSELQLHRLSFLPGTDIVQMAIDAGYYTPEEMEGLMYSPLKEQFQSFKYHAATGESDLWFKMIYCIQFRRLRKKIESFENDPTAHAAKINSLYSRALKYSKIRYVYKKSRVVFKRLKKKRRK